MVKRGKKLTDEERFWAKVNKTSACWEWTGALTRKGYGQFFCWGKVRRSHRVSWQFNKGSPPKQMVLHTCDNRKCVRPSHLFDGSNDDNVKDMVSKGRQARGDTSGRRKLTEADVRIIRKSEASSASLSRQFGVTPAVVWQARAGNTWRHVT